MRRFTLAILLILATVAAAGCGVGGNDDGGKIVRAGGAQPAIKDGRLSSAPNPLTIRDVERPGKTSAASGVLSLYFWIQWGSIPNAVELYDRKARRVIGSTKISDALATQRINLLGALPRIKETVDSRLGTVVTVDSLSKTSSPMRESFLMTREDGRWLVRHDTLLERALGELAAAEARGGRTGSSAQADANRAAQKATREYRTLAYRD